MAKLPVTFMYDEEPISNQTRIIMLLESIDGKLDQLITADKPNTSDELDDGYYGYVVQRDWYNDRTRILKTRSRREALIMCPPDYCVYGTDARWHTTSSDLIYKNTERSNDDD